MSQSTKYNSIWRMVLVGISITGLCMGDAPAYAKDKPEGGLQDSADKSAAFSGDEPAKQSGYIFVKFRKGTSESAIREVADHYEAKEVKNFKDEESSTHEHPAQWRKLRFESVESLKILADRIMQDIRVDEVELQFAR